MLRRIAMKFQMYKIPRQGISLMYRERRRQANIDKVLLDAHASVEQRRRRSHRQKARQRKIHAVDTDSIVKNQPEAQQNSREKCLPSVLDERLGQGHRGGRSEKKRIRRKSSTVTDAQMEYKTPARCLCT